MASLISERKGSKTRYRIQFRDGDNRRRSIRLGSVNRKDADAIRSRIEILNSAKISGQPLDTATSKWVVGIGNDLADKLAAAGLIEKRVSAALGDFVATFIEGKQRADSAESTICNFRQLERSLVDFLGHDRNMRDISEGDADDWRQELVASGYAEATINKLVKRAKQVFRAATRKGMCEVSAFASLKGGSEQNDSRKYFVSRKVIDKVLEACPDAEWRVITALARFGGLRTPSELLMLKWTDIDWAGQKFCVTAPKTKKQGKPYRIVPLFSELRVYLAEALELAPVGAEYVITRYRDPNSNLRTQFLRILRRAGVEPWPKLFQNLRASRETELANEFPLHVVTAWLGNTPKVADKHYLQVTDDHYAQAVANGGAGGGAQVVQHVVPQPAAISCNGSQQMSKASGLTTKKGVIPEAFDIGEAPPVGLEPTTQRLTAACSTN